MSKKTTYGSANAARDAWVETPEETKRVEKVLRQNGKKGPKVKTTGDATPKATRKAKATENRPEAQAMQPVATGATTGDAGPVLAQATEAVLDATTKRIRAPKPKPAATPDATPAPAPGTLAAVAEGYLAAIQRNGRSAGTADSYRLDLAVAMKFLGAETPVATLTADRVREFFEDRRVTHTRKGTPKNPVTVAKTRRILRLALCWAAEQGIIPSAPIPTLDETPATAQA
jgi:hypothetical protein